MKKDCPSKPRANETEEDEEEGAEDEGAKPEEEGPDYNCGFMGTITTELTDDTECECGVCGDFIDIFGGTPVTGVKSN